jgi:hypothetical protein
MRKIICANRECRKEFETTSLAIYCCEDCKKTEIKNRYKDTYKKKEYSVVCVYCGKTFISNKRNRKFCCDYHSSLYYQAQIKKDNSRRIDNLDLEFYNSIQESMIDLFLLRKKLEKELRDM